MDFLVVPKFQILDADGDPLSGGKVYTYAAGTTTPLTTYSDRDLSTPNANPVILDSRGECSIFTDGLIKLVVKDADDTTIYTFDNLRPSYSNRVIDVDEDTEVEVERTSDSDTIHLKVGGTDALVLTGAGISGSLFKDEDNMASNDPGSVCSQQSIKAYVDKMGSVPSGKTILFYEDTVVAGYTLENTLDNKIVYITKGSAAGGQTGGTVHSAGTWTQPDHLHAAGTYTVDTYHRHAPGSGKAGDSFQNIDDYVYTDYQGSTTKALAGSSANSATADTWRPDAYCHTLQTRI